MRRQLRPVALGCVVLAAVLAGCGAPATGQQASVTDATNGGDGAAAAGVPAAGGPAVAGSPCDPLISTLGPAAVASQDVDFASDALRGTFPRVPLAAARAAKPQVLATMATPAQFVQATPALRDPAGRMRALKDAGFRRAVDIAYPFAQGEVLVTVVQLKSAAAAVQYRDAHLADACATSGLMQRVPGVASGVSYLRGSVQNPMTRVVFVVGDSEIALTVCGCTGIRDPRTLAEKWARMVVEAAAPTKA